MEGEGGVRVGGGGAKEVEGGRWEGVGNGGLVGEGSRTSRSSSWVRG